MFFQCPRQSSATDIAFEQIETDVRLLYAVHNGDPRQAEWLAGAGHNPPID
jgi:hypothetical protein